MEDFENKDEEALTEVSWKSEAFSFFVQISGWIAGPIVFSLLLGKYLDKRFHTAPWFFLTLTGISFIVTMVGAVKVSRDYMRRIDKLGKEGKVKEKNGKDEEDNNIKNTSNKTLSKTLNKNDDQ